MFGQSMDNWVAIPLTTFLERYGSQGTLQIFVDAGGGGAVLESVSDELRTIMRSRRHLAPNVPDAFSIDSSATLQNMLGNILNNFGAVVVAIAAISLVIGGIVIMNIMLVTVTERTREIGVRKALGATRRDILLQFLIESALLALIGGLHRRRAGHWPGQGDHAGHRISVDCGLVVHRGGIVCGGVGRTVLWHLSGAQGECARSDYGAEGGAVNYEL